MKLRAIFALFIRSVREDLRAKFTPIAWSTLVLVILFFIAVNQRQFARSPAPGLQVFFIVMLVNLFGLVLAGLTAFCSAITEEKEDDTLGLLRMTNLSPVAILLGKGISRFVGGALLLLAQLPFSMLCVTLGGVSITHILKGYEVLLCTLFLLCNLGLLMSVVAKKTGIAIAFTLVVGVFIYFIGPAIYIWKTGVFPSSVPPSGLWNDFLGYLFANNPVLILGSMLFGAPGRLPVAANPLLSHAIAGTTFFLLAWALFGRFCSGTADTAPRKKRFAKSTNTLRMPRPGLRAIAWKDFWFFVGGRRGLIIRYIGYGVIIFGLAGFMLFENSRTDAEDMGAMFVVLAGMCIGVELVLIGARIFGVERKMLTLSSLLTLPLPLGRIIRHKLIGALPSFIPGLTFVVIGMLLRPIFVDEFFIGISRVRTSEFFLLTYCGLHIFALPLLACWLSLKLRRGAVAAAIAVAAVADILFAVIVDEANRSSETELLVVGSIVLIIINIILARRIVALLPRAAAAD